MPAAAHSSIPPPGPPSRPGVLKFRPSSPLNNASSASSPAATAVSSRFSPARLGHKTVANAPPSSAAASAKLAGRCSRSAAAAAADARATSSGGGRARDEGERGHESSAAMTQRALEGLPVPPPSRFKRFTSFLWSSKRERRKSGENKKNEKEKLNNQSISKERTKSPTAHQSPEYIAGNYGSPSVGARNAWGSPTRQSDETAAVTTKSDKGPWNRDARTRKSFRFSGHITDSGAERNVLPLWLEEAGGARQSGQNFSCNRNEVGSNDVSFESRWDSLNGGNKKQTQVFTVRPPGWEDVDQHVRQKRKKPVKKNPSFCPSFTINEAPKCSLEPKPPADIRPLSPPRIVTTEVPLVTAMGPVNNNTHDAFNMTELSANVDSVTVGSFLQDEVQFSMSNLASHSASNSPARTPSQSSTSAITDRHLWASSDSFICEDFSFCKGVPPKKPKEERLSQHSPPRSFSQVLLNPQNMNEQHLTGHDDLYEDLDVQLSGESSFKTSVDQVCCETEGTSYNSLHTPNSNKNVIGFEASCHLDAENIAEGDSSFPVASNCITSQVEPTYQEVSSSPYRVKEDSFRDNWIRFDCESLNNLAGSSTGVNYDSAGSTISKGDDIDFVHQSNFDMYDGNPLDPVTSPTSPVLYRNFSGSTLNLVEPRLHQTPEIYTGQLVRHYSIRGKRAGKRVTRTVSQKMKPAEYGKLTEPVAPMFSKAALTMTSGPGLFEQSTTLPIDKAVDSEEDAQVEETEKEQKLELPKPTAGNSDLNQTNNSTLSPGLPNRAGSLRVPRLPSIFLRRSLSLNAPKVSRGEVPFQRLPERKGSFRKAMGAIARSFRRRPGERVQTNEVSSHIAEKASSSAPPSRLHRSGSTGSSSRQIPKAPRLPRRTISHKQNSPNEPK
ncbi:uncharacterized protein [Macrobrachium rosenbergii]